MKLNCRFRDLRVLRMSMVSGLFDRAYNTGGGTFTGLNQKIPFSDVSGGLACMSLDRHR